MVDYTDPNFDPNIIATMDPSDWDMDSHALAIQGGFEEAIDSHVQNTGQLPDQEQTAAYMRQAIQDQLPFMTKQTQPSTDDSSILGQPAGDEPTVMGAAAEDGQTATDSGTGTSDAGTNGGGSHLEFPMPPDPSRTGKDHLEWPMPPAPATPQTQEAPTIPQASDLPPPPPALTDPSINQPGKPYVGTMSGDDLLTFARKNGGWVSSGPDAGSHECVPLVKHAVPILGDTSKWQQGSSITSPQDPNLQPGAAIGYGFDENGNYPNLPTGNHAAYLSKSPGKDGTPGSVIEQSRHTPAHERDFDDQYFKQHDWHFITRKP